MIPLSVSVGEKSRMRREKAENVERALGEEDE